MKRKVLTLITSAALIGGGFGLAKLPDIKRAIAKPSCDNPQIKGNVSYRTGTKIYHLPYGRFYDSTQIDTSSGEKMFCSEDEARAAGWRASPY